MISRLSARVISLCCAVMLAAGAGAAPGARAAGDSQTSVDAPSGPIDAGAGTNAAIAAAYAGLVSRVSDLTPAEAADLYDRKPIRFDVIRKDKRVGEHVTRFEETDAGLRVISEMELKIKLLFITAFKFEYESEAVFDKKGLVRLESGTNEIDEDQRIVGQREAGRFVWTCPDGETFEEQGILGTDHWYPAVLDDRTVLNTITGHRNDVTITPKGWETVKTGTGEREAMRVEYSGDLQTVAWYDRAGRWVGLEFEGRDGSMIRYVCTQCGGETA